MPKTYRRKGYAYSKHLLDQLREEFKSRADDESYAPDIENTEEVDDALKLNLGGFIQSNIFNSAEWVAECAERMKDPEKTPTILSQLLTEKILDGFTPSVVKSEIEPNHANRDADIESLELLNKAWERLDNYYNFPDWRESQVNLPHITAKTPLDSFILNVMNGMYPPPEIMLALAKSFKLYLQAAGRLSLEEVLFGKTGSYAKRLRRDSLFTVFHDTLCRENIMYSIATNYPRRSNEYWAERFLNNLSESEELEPNEDYDVETFLRGYRRWKKDNPALADN